MSELAGSYKEGDTVYVFIDGAGELVGKFVNGHVVVAAEDYAHVDCPACCAGMSGKPLGSGDWDLGTPEEIENMGGMNGLMSPPEEDEDGCDEFEEEV